MKFIFQELPNKFCILTKALRYFPQVCEALLLLHFLIHMSRARYLLLTQGRHIVFLLLLHKFRPKYITHTPHISQSSKNAIKTSLTSPWVC